MININRLARILLKYVLMRFLLKRKYYSKICPGSKFMLTFRINSLGEQTTVCVLYVVQSKTFSPH